MPDRSFAIVEAPSMLGLYPDGVETLPEALLAAGLAERLGAGHAGRVEPPSYDPERDPETLLLNPRGIADYSIALADAVGRVVDDGPFPVVLGGRGIGRYLNSSFFSGFLVDNNIELAIQYGGRLGAQHRVNNWLPSPLPAGSNATIRRPASPVIPTARCGRFIPPSGSARCRRWRRTW